MGKKFLSFIMILVMCFTLLPAKKIVTMANVWWSGEGTEQNPYQIKTAEDLKALADHVNAGYTCENEYFKLMNDIDLSSVCGEDIGISWTPIGNIMHDDDSEKRIEFKPFNGIFDGNGCTIKNLYIKLGYDDIDDDDNVMPFQGLFGYVGLNGVIKNLTVEDSFISVFVMAGGIAGVNVGKIENCSNVNIAACGMIDKKISEIIDKEDYDEIENDSCNAIFGLIAGGIACINEGIIEKCDNIAPVVGVFEAAGIVATNSSNFFNLITGGECALNSFVPSIINCSNNGPIIAILSAGIAAENDENSVIERCNNSGSIIGSISGGIVGSKHKNALIVDCTNAGKVYKYIDDNWTICDDIIGYDENTEEFDDEDFQFENNSC